METQPGLRDRKKQQTREALVGAALRLVDERGLDRVTVEEISAAAGVSGRTFFNYFATKDDAILGDPVTDGPDMCRGLLEQPPELTIVEAVRRVLVPAVEQIQADREIWQLRLRVIKNNPALMTALIARGSAEEQRFVAAIAARTGLPAGHLFPHLAASLTGSAFRTAMMRWAVDGYRRPLSDYVSEAFDALADGLTTTNEQGNT